MTNCRIGECLAVLAFLPPVNQAVGSANTPGHQIAMFRRFQYVLSVGTIMVGGTVSLKVQASPDGTTWTDVPGAAITPITTANQVAILEVYDERIVALGLGGYIRAVVTVAAAACQTSLVLLGGDGRFQPASDYNTAGVNAPVYL